MDIEIFPDTSQKSIPTIFKLKKGSEGWSIKIPYLIQKILPEKSLCCLYGPHGSYKSFLAFSWACHIASGEDWDGNIAKKGAVLYIAAEGGSGIALRIKAWEQYKRNSVDLLYRIDEPVQLTSPSHMTSLQHSCDEITQDNELKLIVIDTVSRCFNGKDENSTKDMGEFIRQCDILRNRYGATVLLIHHSGKDKGKGARGSSALPAASDVEIFVSKSSTTSPQLNIEFTKFKDAEEPKPSSYDLKTIDIYNNTKRIGSSLVVVDKGNATIKAVGKNQQHILNAVREIITLNKPCSYNEIRHIAIKNGASKDTLKRTVDSLVTQGQLKVDEQKRYHIPNGR